MRPPKPSSFFGTTRSEGSANWYGTARSTIAKSSNVTFQGQVKLIDNNAFLMYDCLSYYWLRFELSYLSVRSTHSLLGMKSKLEGGTKVNR